MANPYAPRSRYRRFYVDVYHKGEHVGNEPVLARDLKHAHHMGAYIASTVAREAIHPRDYDRSRVSFQVNDPLDTQEQQPRNVAVSEQATRKG